MKTRKKPLLKVTRTLSYYAFAVIWFFPIFWLLSKTFTPHSEIIASFARIIPENPTIVNLKNVMEGWPFARWLLNSLIVTVGSVFVSTVVSVLAAFSFARLKWKGRNVIFILFLTSMFIPWEINAIPLYFIAKTLGLLNSYQGIFLPISSMPIGVFLLRQFFINIPQDLEDAARIDGCSSLGILYHIILPMSFAAVAAFIIFIYIFTWNEFFWSLISLQGSKMLTLPIGLKTIMGAHDVAYGNLFGASFLAMIPSLLIFLLLRKKIIKGISITGSLK